MQVRIRKRPWWAWLMWVLWALWLLFWAEIAIGSWGEREPVAYWISLAVFLSSFLAGFHVWLVSFLRTRKR